MRNTLWIGALALPVLLLACKGNEKSEALPDAGSIDAGGSDGGSDSGPIDTESESETETDTGTEWIDSGPDDDTDCEPGTLECICGANGYCEPPGKCVGTHCHLTAVWGPWNGNDEDKELLWWSDQGVWQ